tara:strand:- start:26 stop:511 length:486 start_codon:yes stop_codon:yes gene_type:complete
MNIFNGNLIPTNELKMDCESAKQLEFAFENKHSLILDCYNKRNTNRAIREIIDLTDNVNSFIQNKKPWDLAKQISETNKMHLKVQLHLILSLAINYFAKLTILLKPIVPITCKVIEEEIFSLEEPWDMLDYDRLCIGKIRGFKHMLSRIKPEDLETLMKKR